MKFKNSHKLEILKNIVATILVDRKNKGCNFLCFSFKTKKIDSFLPGLLTLCKEQIDNSDFIFLKKNKDTVYAIIGMFNLLGLESTWSNQLAEMLVSSFFTYRYSNLQFVVLNTEVSMILKTLSIFFPNKAKLKDYRYCTFAELHTFEESTLFDFGFLHGRETEKIFVTYRNRYNFLQGQPICYDEVNIIINAIDVYLRIKKCMVYNNSVLIIEGNSKATWSFYQDAKFFLENIFCIIPELHVALPFYLRYIDLKAIFIKNRKFLSDLNVRELSNYLMKGRITLAVEFTNGLLTESGVFFRFSQLVVSENKMVELPDQKFTPYYISLCNTKVAFDQSIDTNQYLELLKKIKKTL